MLTCSRQLSSRGPFQGQKSPRGLERETFFGPYPARRSWAAKSRPNIRKFALRGLAMVVGLSCRCHGHSTSEHSHVAHEIPKCIIWNCSHCSLLKNCNMLSSVWGRRPKFKALFIGESRRTLQVALPDWVVASRRSPALRIKASNRSKSYCAAFLSRGLFSLWSWHWLALKGS